MKVYVVNLADQPERWASILSHLTQFDGLEVERWDATPASSIAPHELPDWTGEHLPGNLPKRVAIVRSYRTLLETLTDGGPWIIVQDDIRFERHPALERPTQSAIHLYGGSTKGRGQARRWKGDPRLSHHVHPLAFRINAEAAASLAILLTDESRQICETWTPLLYDATFDNPPTVEHLP